MTYCCKKRLEGRPRINNTLLFRRDELLLDIENYAFVTADIMPTEDAHRKHQVFDIAQDGNEDLVTRILNLAYTECLEFLYPYTKTPCRQGDSHDDELIVPQSYEFALALPEDFSHTTALLLKELIHDYFVCRVLTEWLGITNPEVYTYWRARLEGIVDRIKRALLSRRKPLRRKQSMF